MPQAEAPSYQFRILLPMIEMCKPLAAALTWIHDFHAIIGERKEILMPPHLLVAQLRFARSEFVRCLEGVSEQDARQRIGPMNCISWVVGHLANQEHNYWMLKAQGKNLVPDLNERVGSGRPASAPSLEEMWAVWRVVTREADQFLDTLTAERLPTYFARLSGPRPESIGTMLLRVTYHYWFHTGEAHAIRQQLGHGELPQFVGDMTQAAYRPESSSADPMEP
jgi:uncharacterized damage-inducible protein DinB